MKHPHLALAVPALVLAACAAPQPVPPPAPGPVVGMPAPRYLSVLQFATCLGEQNMGSYRAWCLPAAKPAACPEPSWQQLNQMTGPDRLPACSRP